MSKNTVRNASRLRFGVYQGVDDYAFWDRIDYPDIPVQADDLEWVVRGGERLDILAKRFYGDPVLQWVIALVNDLDLWPSDVYAGQTLRIPAPRYVRDELFQLARF